MSQGFAANGTINVAHLSICQLASLSDDLTNVLDIQDLTVNTEGDQLSFTAYGEVCAGDDVPADLHELAKKHCVNFMANIDQNDEGYDVYFLEPMKWPYAR